MTECYNACEPAQCCISEGADNCFESNHQICSTYGICFIDDAVASACSQDSLGTEVGRQRCNAMCDDYACCFFPGTENCFDEREQKCMTLSPCFALLGLGVEELRPGDDEQQSSSVNAPSSGILLAYPDPLELLEICSVTSPNVSDFLANLVSAFRLLLCR